MPSKSKTKNRKTKNRKTLRDKLVDEFKNTSPVLLQDDIVHHMGGNAKSIRNKKSFKKTSTTTIKSRKVKIKNKKTKQRKIKGGMSGVHDEFMRINIISNDSHDLQILVRPADNIYKSVVDGLGDTPKHRVIIRLGEDKIEPDGTFQEYEIETGARLNVEILARKGFSEILEDIIKLNLHLHPDILMLPEVGPDGSPTFNIVEPWRINGNVNWGSEDITYLPESFGDLIVNGKLYLNDNQLTTLPDSFGYLTVDGNIYLNGNELASLPDSFVKLISTHKLSKIDPDGY